MNDEVMEAEIFIQPLDSNQNNEDSGDEDGETPNN